jgi:hypothetical protein
MDHVYSMLKSDTSASDPTYFVDSYLLTLTTEQQLEIARTLSTDATTAYARYGALLLVRLKHADEAVAPAAHLLLTGGDINELFWSWRNFDDPCLTDSMTLHLGRYLLGEYRKLPGTEKRRAEDYLVSISDQARKFSVAHAQASLKSVEERLAQRGCPDLAGSERVRTADSDGR